MREEIKKMDKISKEAKLLCRKNIQSAQELSAYKKSLILDRKENKAKVESLWKKNRKAANESDKQKNYEEIKMLQSEIKKLNQEIELIEGIETRTPKIKEIIDEVENRNQDKEKEKENSEYIK